MHFISSIVKWPSGILVVLILSSALLSNNVIAQERADSYILENDQVKLTVGRNTPVIREYVLKENGAVLQGNTRGLSPEILVYRDVSAVNSGSTEISYRSRMTGNNYDISYHATVTVEGQPAVEFDLVYSLRGPSVVIEFGNVTEHENFYLIHVILPDLVTVGGNDNGPKLAIPAEAGRLVDVNRASNRRYEYEIDWLNGMLAAFAYHSGAIGIMDTESIENHSIATVYDAGGRKYGTLGMKVMHRLKEYDLQEFGPIIPAADPKYLLKVQSSCTVTLSLAGDYDKDGAVSWVDGTKVVRDKIYAVPNPFYADKYTAKIFIDRPTDEEYLTFEEILDRIKTFANQTDSAGRVIYLAGWQYQGHDTGYPSVDRVNERLGGFDGLVHLITEARKYNAIVSFHDNYDDAYKEHPGWDSDIIARDPRGNLMKGGQWAGGKQSYLISNYKYAMKSGLDRARSTLKKYPVRDTYHIDVLAGGYNAGRKYDFNPESPAGAVKNFEGKLKIIHEFNDHGIDVTTEDFSSFFVGHVGAFLAMIAFDSTYFQNEERIPLLPFVYHGKISYGMKVSNRSDRLLMLLYGQTFGPSGSVRRVFGAEDYILDALPKLKLYGKPMKSYSRNGDTERVVYEDGSVVEVNIKANTYSVALPGGKVIARNFTSFIPVKENVYFACSKDGGLLSYPVPTGWEDKKDIEVLRMNANGSRKKVRFNLRNGNLEFQTEPGAPYKVVYND
jgi:hypothetical protein